MDFTRMFVTLAAVFQLALVAGRVTSHRKDLKRHLPLQKEDGDLDLHDAASLKRSQQLRSSRVSLKAREFIARNRGSEFPHKVEGGTRNDEFSTERFAKERRPAKNTKRRLSTMSRILARTSNSRQLKKMSLRETVAKEMPKEKRGFKDEIFTNFENELESLVAHALRHSNSNNEQETKKEVDPSFGVDVAEELVSSGDDEERSLFSETVFQVDGTLTGDNLQEIKKQSLETADRDEVTELELEMLQIHNPKLQIRDAEHSNSHSHHHDADHPGKGSGGNEDDDDDEDEERNLDLETEMLNLIGPNPFKRDAEHSNSHSHHHTDTGHPGKGSGGNEEDDEDEERNLDLKRDAEHSNSHHHTGTGHPGKGSGGNEEDDEDEERNLDLKRDAEHSNSHHHTGTGHPGKGSGGNEDDEDEERNLDLETEMLKLLGPNPFKRDAEHSNSHSHHHTDTGHPGKGSGGNEEDDEDEERNLDLKRDAEHSNSHHHTGTGHPGKGSGGNEDDDEDEERNLDLETEMLNLIRPKPLKRDAEHSNSHHHTGTGHPGKGSGGNEDDDEDEERNLDLETEMLNLLGTNPFKRDAEHSNSHSHHHTDTGHPGKGSGGNEEDDEDEERNLDLKRDAEHSNSHHHTGTGHPGKGSGGNEDDDEDEERNLELKTEMLKLLGPNPLKRDSEHSNSHSHHNTDTGHPGKGSGGNEEDDEDEERNLDLKRDAEHSNSHHHTGTGHPGKGSGGNEDDEDEERYLELETEMLKLLGPNPFKRDAEHSNSHHHTGTGHPGKGSGGNEDDEDEERNLDLETEMLNLLGPNPLKRDAEHSNSHHHTGTGHPGKGSGGSDDDEERNVDLQLRHMNSDDSSGDGYSSGSGDGYRDEEKEKRTNTESESSESSEEKEKRTNTESESSESSEEKEKRTNTESESSESSEEKEKRTNTESESSESSEEKERRAYTDSDSSDEDDFMFQMQEGKPETRDPDDDRHHGKKQKRGNHFNSSHKHSPDIPKPGNPDGSGDGSGDSSGSGHEDDEDYRRSNSRLNAMHTSSGGGSGSGLTDDESMESMEERANPEFDMDFMFQLEQPRDNGDRGHDDRHHRNPNVPHPEHQDEASPVKRGGAPTGDKPVDTSEGCNKQLIAETSVKILYSHDGYVNGEDYPDKMECVFEILAPANYYIWFHFLTFDIEDDSQCSFDFVQIYRDELSRENNATNKLCGSVSPGVVTVGSTKAYIHFHTDSSETLKGFKLEYKAYDPTIVPQRSCLYGNEPTCAFQCHCAQTACNPLTGGCLVGGCVDEPAFDDRLEIKWTGDGCVMGNVALGKHAFTLSGDANQVTDGYSGSRSISDHCVTVKADKSADSMLTVDLGGLFQVDYIKVYGAPEGTAESNTLRDFYVKQSGSRDNTPSGCNTYLGQVFGSDTMECRVHSRFISITRFEDPLYSNYDMVVCEVQVFGYKLYDVDCSRCEASSCEEDKLCKQCQVTFTEPTCGEIIDCGVPAAPDHGSVQYTTTHRPSVAEFYCDEGYSLKGYSTAMCGYETDQWDGIAQCVQRCGSVPRVDNAFYPGVYSGLEGDVVEYTCEDNYSQTGGSYLICSDGQWSNPSGMPKCEAVNCKDIRIDDPNIRVVYENGTNTGSVYIYTCDEGYFIRGQVNNQYVMRCLVSGEWDKLAPRCEAFCGDFYTSTEGTLSSENYPNKYPALTNCTWVIQAPRPGYQFLVAFKYMQIEDSTDCIYDRLNLYDSNGYHMRHLKTYCGNGLPPAIQTQGNYLIVNFYTDEGFQANGFLIEYKAIRSVEVFDASAALLYFYPVLVGQRLLQMDTQIFVQAVTYMRSFLLTATGLESHGDCLFLLEAIDAAYNLLAHHALPEVMNYISGSFARAEVHAPTDYQTMRIIQQVRENQTISGLIQTLYNPFVALGNEAIQLSGLDIADASAYDAMQGLFFHELEDLLFEKTYIVPFVPAEELAIHVAIEAHRQVTAVLGTSPNSQVICRPLYQTLTSFISAIDGTIRNVEQLLATLPALVKAGFGPNAEDFADLFIEELAEGYQKLAAPLQVITDLRNEIFNVDLDDLQSIGSGTTPIPGVISPQELRIKYTGPATTVLLEHGLELTIDITRKQHIEAEIMKEVLTYIPDAKTVSVKDLSKDAVETIIRSIIEKIKEGSYVSCLEPKISAMIIGLAEVQLFDIALSDHNMTALGSELINIITRDAPYIDANAVLANIINNFRAALFNSYRRLFLSFESEVVNEFNGYIPSKTIPLEFIIRLASEMPANAYTLVDKAVEIMMFGLNNEVNCPSSDVYRKVGLAAEDFVGRFNLDAIIQEIYSNLIFLDNISSGTRDQVLSRMRQHMADLLGLILGPYDYLKVYTSQMQYKVLLKEYVTQGLGVLIYNILHMEPEKPVIDIEDLVRVLHQHHQGMKMVLLQYIQDMRQILQEVGGDQIDICKVYPEACDFNLELSLTRR